MIARSTLRGWKSIYQAFTNKSHEKVTQKKNTQEFALVVLYLCKIISIFYCNHLEKQIATSQLIDFGLLMVKSIVKPKVEISDSKTSTK